LGKHVALLGLDTLGALGQGEPNPHEAHGLQRHSVRLHITSVNQRFRIRTFLSDLTIRNSNGFARSRLTEQIRIHFLLDSAASV